MPLYDKGLVLNDTHYPFENPKAIALALAVGRAFDPDIVFLNGDIMDCWQISRYVKNPKLHSQADLQYELERAKSFLKTVRELFPRAKIYYIFGNHEWRWHCYITNNAIELFGLKGLSLEEQLEFKELNIIAVNTGNKENSFLWGKLLIGHFDRVNKHSGMTAKNLIEDKAISLIQAHTHRGGSSYRRLYDRDIVGYENFCLCSRNPDYVDRPNWQLGFSLVYKDKETDFFYVEQHPIIEEQLKNNVKRYKTFFNGRMYQT